MERTRYEQIKKIRIAIEAIYILTCLFYLTAVVFTASNEGARSYSILIAVTFMVVVIIRTIAIELMRTLVVIVLAAVCAELLIIGARKKSKILTGLSGLALGLLFGEVVYHFDSLILNVGFVIAIILFAGILIFRKVR